MTIPGPLDSFLKKQEEDQELSGPLDAYLKLKRLPPLPEPYQPPADATGQLPTSDLPDAPTFVSKPAPFEAQADALRAVPTPVRSEEDRLPFLFGRASAIQDLEARKLQDTELQLQLRAARQPTIGAQPTGLKKIVQKLSNISILAPNKGIVGNRVTDGGIPIGTAISSLTQLVHGAVTNPVGLIGGFAEGLIKPPIALALDMAVDNSYLLPEEREEYAKMVLANGVGLLVGASFRAAATPVKNLSKLSTSELMALGRTTPSIASERLGIAIKEGLAGGAAAGVVEGAYDPKRATELAISYAAMSVPLGLLFEGVAYPAAKKASRQMQSDASTLAQIRMLQDIENQSLEFKAKVGKEFASGTSIPESVVRSHESLPTHATTVFPLSDVRELQVLRDLSDEVGADLVFHTTPEGVSYAAVGGSESPLKSRAFRSEFERTGYMHGQAVNYQGKDYIYRGRPATLDKGQRNKVVIEAPATGARITVNVDDLHRVNNIKFDDPLMLVTRNLDGTQVVDEKGSPKTVYHGTPITFEEFDVLQASNENLYNAGLYFTEASGIASEYPIRKPPRDAPDLDDLRFERDHINDRVEHLHNDLGALENDLEAAIKIEEGDALGSDGPVIRYAIDDIYNPGRLDPTTGEPVLITKKGDVIDANLYADLVDVGLDAHNYVDITRVIRPGQEAFTIKNLRTAIEEQIEGVLTLLDPLSENLTKLELDIAHLVQPQVRPVQLNIKNPFRIDKRYALQEVTEIAQKLDELLEDFTHEYGKFDDIYFLGGAKGKGFVTGNELYQGIYSHLYSIVEGTTEAAKLADLPGPGKFPTSEFTDFFGKQVRRNPASLITEQTRHIINKMLAVAGFDGITHIGGRTTGGESHRVWIAFHNDQIIPKFAQKETTIFPIGVPTSEATKRVILDDFKEFAFPGGYEKGLEKDFKTTVIKYATKRGYTADDIPALESFLSSRIGEELRVAALDPEELVAFKVVEDELNRIRATEATDLATTAYSAGMYVDQDVGTLRVRDAETGNTLGRFYTAKDAKDFIHTVGRDGPDLDGGSTIPPDGVVGGNTTPPPAGGGHTEAWSPKQNGFLGNLRAWVNATTLGRHLTPMREVMSAFDNTWGTSFAVEVWDKLNAGFLRRNASLLPDLQEARGIADFMNALSTEERMHVSVARETLDAEEMVKLGGLFKNRSFTEREVSGAHWFADRDVDITKAYQYRRALKEIQDKADRGRIDPASLSRRVQQLNTSMGMDEVHIEASGVLDQILKLNDPDNLSILAVVRLAEAIMDPEGNLSKVAYIKKHNMSAKAQIAMRRLDQAYEKYAPKFDIPEQQRLAAYMNHSRRFKDNILIKNQGERTPTWVHDLLRTGELVDYERDPVTALVRYIQAGHNRIHINQLYDEAIKYIQSETRKIGKTNKESAEMVRRVLTKGYLEPLRGIPHDEVKMTQELFNNFLDRTGIKIDLDIRRDLVNTFLSLNSSALIGFRPMQAMRDFWSVSNAYYARFGTKRTGAMLSILQRVNVEELKRLGIIVDNTKNLVEVLAERGVTPGISAIQTLTNAELQAQSLGAAGSRGAKLRGAIQDIGELGIKWGGQHSVYQWAHAATYLESSTRALKLLDDVSINKITKEKAYKELFLNSYEPAVAKEFDTLVRAGRFEDAARFLGRATSFETVNIFGLANHPQGWSSNIGRIAGQFGSWPVWARTTISRGLVRGTALERAGVAARWGISHTGLYLTGKALGLNLQSWMFGAGALFVGGPVISSTLSVNEALSGADSEKSLAQHRLVRLWMMGVPGALQIRDIMRAVDLAQRGANPATAFLQALGVKAEQGSGGRLPPSLLNPGGVQ